MTGTLNRSATVRICRVARVVTLRSQIEQIKIYVRDNKRKVIHTLESTHIRPLLRAKRYAENLSLDARYAR